MYWYHFYSNLCESDSKLILSYIFQTCTMANNLNLNSQAHQMPKHLKTVPRALKSIAFAENKIFSRCSLNLFPAHVACLYATKQKYSTPRQQDLWTSSGISLGLEIINRQAKTAARRIDGRITGRTNLRENKRS